jgi:hypothetical protein
MQMATAKEAARRFRIKLIDLRDAARGAARMVFDM